MSQICINNTPPLSPSLQGPAIISLLITSLQIIFYLHYIPPPPLLLHQYYPYFKPTPPIQFNPQPNPTIISPLILHLILTTTITSQFSRTYPTTTILFPPPIKLSPSHHSTKNNVYSRGYFQKTVTSPLA